MMFAHNLDSWCVGFPYLLESSSFLDRRRVPPLLGCCSLLVGGRVGVLPFVGNCFLLDLGLVSVPPLLENCFHLDEGRMGVPSLHWGFLNLVGG